MNIIAARAFWYNPGDQLVDQCMKPSQGYIHHHFYGEVVEDGNHSDKPFQEAEDRHDIERSFKTKQGLLPGIITMNLPHQLIQDIQPCLYNVRHNYDSENASRRHASVPFDLDTLIPGRILLSIDLHDLSREYHGAAQTCMHLWQPDGTYDIKDYLRLLDEFKANQEGGPDPYRRR
jgi:hypothetical protein